MLAIQFQDRIINFKDWATILFVLSFVIIAINKNIFEVRFNEFIRLAISNKYTKIYKDSNNVRSTFTASMFFVQLFSFSFFILLFLKHFIFHENSDKIVFLQIFTFLGVFILSKYLIEKIIATTFKMEEFVDQFNLLKVSYRTYFSLLLLPINIILFYNPETNKSWVYLSLAAIIIITNFIIYIITLKTYQNLVIRKIFYFILYLCTLEIAPYYFMYYFITKN
ncbi:hypothetical protein SY27_09725 [Flavobacterium sp. 316]|uniref:DUF4271 domain-containing protein n=2 Tax=Flavobacteriaceae TaxID=49546 RepID=A0ABY4HRV7_9FLAO|nr:DUF4271 domain-containing protein [Flavobacterium sp. 316]KIX21306.1 hypothetical protein SY27_09725 [Flavobacterium sp. 316]UOX35622.1 DUF4271 domain-containing protein [Flavobacterium sediminilitoris]